MRKLGAEADVAVGEDRFEPAQRQGLVPGPVRGRHADGIMVEEQRSALRLHVQGVQDSVIPAGVRSRRSGEEGGFRLREGPVS